MGGWVSRMNYCSPPTHPPTHPPTFPHTQEITPRVYGMAFPTPPDSVARLLSYRYKTNYMVWNLSEETYDYALFDNQVGGWVGGGERGGLYELITRPTHPPILGAGVPFSGLPFSSPWFNGETLSLH